MSDFLSYLTIYKVTITHFIMGYFSIHHRDRFLSLINIFFFLYETLVQFAKDEQANTTAYRSYTEYWQNL